MHTGLKFVTFWLGLSLLFSACSSAEGEASPTPNPEAVLTAAAHTAEAQMTELAAPQPTNTSPSTPVDTQPADTPAAPNATPVLPQGTMSPAPTAVTGGTNLAEFWADVTIPDGTDFNPGEEFTKIWKLRNSGTNTWTPDYSFAFFTGEQMSAQNQVSLGANVVSGDTVDIAVDMVAPETGGNYMGYWKMRDPAGEFFDYAVYVQIDVVGGSQPAETSAPPPSGSGKVSRVSIQVDNASPEDCPYTFTFTASFTLDQPATVTYRMEAGSDTPGFTFNLPGDFTGVFDAGTHSVTYYLQIEDSVNGWAQFHVLSPNDAVSNQTTFSLSCGS
ncbi:MAG: NBR1-Ig-like domain-containing protein [Anaerolineales bacterium]|jgi:hypothetical protein